MAADPSMRALLERDRGLLRWIVKTAPGGVLDRGARPQDRKGSRDRSRRRCRRADLGSARRGQGDQARGFPARAARHATPAASRGSTTSVGIDDAGAHGRRLRRGADRGADRTGARVLRRVSLRGFQLEARRTSVPARHHRSVDRLVADRARGRRRGAARRRSGSGKSCSIAPRSRGDRRRRCDREPRVAGHARVARAEDRRQLGEGAARSLRDGALRAGRVRATSRAIAPSTRWSRSADIAAIARSC